MSSKHLGSTTSPIWGSKTSRTDRSEILHRLGLRDVVTHAKLDDDRLDHFCMMGLEFEVFPLTFVVVLTTLGHYHAVYDV